MEVTCPWLCTCPHVSINCGDMRMINHFGCSNKTFLYRAQGSILFLVLPLCPFSASGASSSAAYNTWISYITWWFCGSVACTNWRVYTCCELKIYIQYLCSQSLSALLLFTLLTLTSAKKYQGLMDTVYTFVGFSPFLSFLPWIVYLFSHINDKMHSPFLLWMVTYFSQRGNSFP